jgi:drug/metabolite transporter (DMT)-like permease
MTASTLNGVGLVWVAASVNQMMRGSMIFFTGIFTVLILKRSLKWAQWGGILIVMLGLVLVGLVGFFRGGSGTGATAVQALVGAGLILAGSALNSLQNVCEEKLLKGLATEEADPMEVVGWEGVFGTLVTAFVMLPIVQAIPFHDPGDCGRVEDTLDTLTMLWNDPVILAAILGYSVALAFMNGYSQILSKYMSAVIRMLVNTCRTVLVWSVDLTWFYKIPGGKAYGEQWDKYSLLELGGFVLLIVGTMTYVHARSAGEQHKSHAEIAAEKAQAAADGTSTAVVVGGGEDA